MRIKIGRLRRPAHRLDRCGAPQPPSATASSEITAYPSIEPPSVRRRGLVGCGTASSLLNESGKWNPDAFERAMSRQVGATVSSVYNRSEYWSERIEMMQWWSDWLDAPRWGMNCPQTAPNSARLGVFKGNHPQSPAEDKTLMSVDFRPGAGAPGGRNGAQKRTRTSTPLRAPAPEAGASTNSAIWARAAGRSACCEVGARL